MGAPVCANTFIFPRCHLLCAIKIEDSLEENTSYFYAEVKRLKEIFSTLQSEKNHLPCVFFVDEIFKGTNNTERFIGSWYILKALFETKTFGFVSTHDLVLTRLAQFDPRLVNMHFREHVEHDHLLFDYTLRGGPCTSSNALRIMRLEGLPIPENTEEAQDLLT
jgi:DNA mismatch repair ATPase MutS